MLMTALSALCELPLLNLRACGECPQARTHLQNSRSVAKGSSGPSLTIKLVLDHQRCRGAAGLRGDLVDNCYVSFVG